MIPALGICDCLTPDRMDVGPGLPLQGRHHGHEKQSHQKRDGARRMQAIEDRGTVVLPWDRSHVDSQAPSYPRAVSSDIQECITCGYPPALWFKPVQELQSLILAQLAELPLVLQ